MCPNHYVLIKPENVLNDISLNWVNKGNTYRTEVPIRYLFVFLLSTICLIFKSNLSKCEKVSSKRSCCICINQVFLRKHLGSPLKSAFLSPLKVSLLLMRKSINH